MAAVTNIAGLLMSIESPFDFGNEDFQIAIYLHLGLVESILPAGNGIKVLL